MKIVSYLLIFLIPVLIVLSSFRIVVFDTGFYNKEFSKLGVYDKFGNETLSNNTNNLISYLNGRGNLNKNFFNERETAHLADVKELVSKGHIALYLIAITVILLIAYIFMKKDYGMLGKIVVYSGIISLLIILLFLLAVSTDFQGFFTKFHLLSFDNDLWLLNPEDNLIKLFPERFFYDATLRIIYIAVGISLASITFGLILLKYSRKH